MKGKKKSFLALLLGTVCLCSLTGCKIGDTEYVLYHKPVEDHAVFSVNGENYSEKEALIYLANYSSIYGNAYGMDLWQTGFENENLEDYVKGITLEELTRIACMDQLAAQQELSLDQEELDAVDDMAEEYYNSLSDEDKEALGVSQEDVKTAYTHYALAEKLYASLTDGVDAEVSEDQARVMQVMLIYVTDLDTAKTIKQKLDDGSDFSVVAETYSEISTKQTSLARGQMDQAIEEAAFELEDGQYSNRIAVEDGYYFVYCVSKMDQELTEENKEIIRQKQEEANFEDLYSDFTDSSDFALNQEVWDGLTLESYDLSTNSFFTVYDQNVK